MQMNDFDRRRMPGYVPSTPDRGAELAADIATRFDSMLAPYKRMAAEAHMQARHDPDLNASLSAAAGGESADDVWADVNMDKSIDQQALMWALLELMHAADALGVSWRRCLAIADSWHGAQRAGMARQIVWRSGAEPENDNRPGFVRA